MIKTLIAAAFLSQSPIHAIKGHVNDHVYETDARLIYTMHIRRVGLSTEVVRDTFMDRKPPVPYYGPWAAPYGQTAQQWIAIVDMLAQEGIDLDWEDPTR